MLKHLTLTVSALMAIDLAAAEAHLPDAASCSAKFGHADQRTCLEQKASARQERIAIAERRVREAIAHWDQEQTYRDQSVALLNASRKAYLTQRKATCEVEASAAAGGNGAGNSRLQCQERWDIKWREQLAILEKMFGRDAQQPVAGVRER